MGRLLQFPTQPAKIDFTRVRKKRDPGTTPGQINLFSNSSPNVIPFAPRGGHFDQALDYDEHNDFQKAEELYRKAIETGDCPADAHCNLGILESKKGHTARAFDCFTQSLKLEPRHTEAHYNLGNLYFDLGDFRLAKVHYEMAAETDPQFASVFFNLGLVLAINNEFQSAITALIKYQELVGDEESRKADALLTNLRQSDEVAE